MKKFFTSVISCVFALTAFSQNGQISNGGFENWTTTTLYDYTTIWKSSNEDQFSGVPTAFKSMDAQLGTYSAEIRSVAFGTDPDTLFGYVFHGQVGQTGPDGGIPYTATFNTVKFQYKCDLPVANDSVYIYVIRFVSGTPVEFSMVPAVGGTQSTWTQGSITISALPQEELFLGFVMGNPMNGVNCAPGAWARFDNVEMYNGSVAVTNVPDPSFESWSTKTSENPDNWFTMNDALAGLNLENVIKTTDANSGTYAAEISTMQFPDNGDTIGGALSLGPINLSASMNPFLFSPYNANPTTFSGAYKYVSVNGDQANIQIQFYDNGVNIGSHSEYFTASASYTSFSSPLTIIGTPDSILFVAFSGGNPGSTLTLDDLSFSGGNVGLEEFQKLPASIYPNPANEIVMVKAEGIYSFELINLAGAVVRSANEQVGAIEVDICKLDAGTYFIRINNSDSTKIHKLIIE